MHARNPRRPGRDGETPLIQSGDAPAIRVSGLGKTYRMWSSPTARLTVPLMLRGAAMLARVAPGIAATLRNMGERRARSHRALDGIDFTLARGEAMGIVGLNGSGKSTLLQIIAGVLTPSTGYVAVNGRIAALLELGSGFNPELTGRENVVINAAILGLDRARIDASLDRIIAFADIGPYIDEPVKTYSSGMALRLAFAVQVHVEPDILIVDEALAVGDAAFQAKAMARIDEILATGTTLLFVGHDLNAVKAFCHRAMLLEQGRIVLQGSPDEVIAEYVLRTHRKALLDAGRARDARDLHALGDGYGSQRAQVTACTLNGATHATLGFGGRVQVAMDVQVASDVLHPVLIFDVVDARGLQLTGRRVPLQRAPDSQACTVSIGFDACFQQGVYRIRTRIIDSPSLELTTALARQEGTLSFEVIDDSRALFTGLFPVPMDIEAR